MARLRPQPVDRALAVAEHLAEDRVGVLAEARAARGRVTAPSVLIGLRSHAPLPQGGVGALGDEHLPDVGADGVAPLVRADRLHGHDAAIALPGLPQLEHPAPRVQSVADERGLLVAELVEIFRGRTTAEWLDLGNRANTPIAPVNTPKTLADDPQFQDRLPWIPQERVGHAQVPSPIKVVGEAHPPPERAPDAGQHTDAILREVLGYTDDRITALRDAGALG